MRIGSLLSSSGANTLFGRYAIQIRSERRQNSTPSEGERLLSATEAAFNDLRNKLGALSREAERLRNSDSARSLITRDLVEISNPAPGGEGSGGGESSPAPVGGVSISTANSNKPVPFSRLVQRAFKKGFRSENDRIIKNPKLSGDIQVSLGEESFSIRVDSNTTVKQFMDELSAKAGDKLDISLVNSGGKLKLQLRPGAGAGDPDQNSGGGTVGEGGFQIADLSAEARDVIQQVKRFVGTYNKVVRYTRKGETLIAETGLDQGLALTLKKALRESTGDGGRLSFGDFVSFRSDGKLVFNEERLKEAFAEDPEAVFEILSGVAENIAGREGIARDFSARGGVLDQTLVALSREKQVKLAPKEQTAEANKAALNQEVIRNSLSVKA
jgi:hypothetical protein